METGIYNRLLEIVREDQVKINEPMKDHTTFRVGGPADFFVTPESADEVRKD